MCMCVRKQMVSELNIQYSCSGQFQIKRRPCKVSLKLTDKIAIRFIWKRTAIRKSTCSWAKWKRYFLTVAWSTGAAILVYVKVGAGPDYRKPICSSYLPSHTFSACWPVRCTSSFINTIDSCGNTTRI